MNIDFDTYLAEKKIDSIAFKTNEPEKWQSFKQLFETIHPNSFTAQKKFLINDLRRLYYLRTQPQEPFNETEQPEVKKPSRPVVKRAVITKKPDEGE